MGAYSGVKMKRGGQIVLSPFPNCSRGQQFSCYLGDLYFFMMKRCPTVYKRFFTGAQQDMYMQLTGHDGAGYLTDEALSLFATDIQRIDVVGRSRERDIALALFDLISRHQAIYLS